MEESNSFESTNINALWLQNIYENLKNLEFHERLAREGCNSIIEYIQMPYDKRNIFLSEVQYKNLRFIITEINLLLTDLSPVVNEKELEEYRKQLDNLERVINLRKLFIREIYSSIKKEITKSEMTPFFLETVGFVTKLRVNIIKSIAHLLYVQQTDKTAKSW